MFSKNKNSMDISEKDTDEQKIATARNAALMVGKVDKTILFIDDNFGNRRLLESIMHKTRFTLNGRTLKTAFVSYYCSEAALGMPGYEEQRFQPLADLQALKNASKLYDVESKEYNECQQKIDAIAKNTIIFYGS